ncbi:hypothetical protein [Piscirickettsia litoralis]|uniref:Uncharacterized protein n=1 Tax=Piscirickettsia litoralis TaxID=1891921 RepID=A0ABX3A0B7_9GAMM|nr:hypothetical protein [Piscirickettsia litoralis]ODN42296.1 hypothetical protein BGC07_04310 [Piscirickettsia litoralis]
MSHLLKRHLDALQLSHRLYDIHLVKNNELIGHICSPSHYSPQLIMRYFTNALSLDTPIDELRLKPSQHTLQLNEKAKGFTLNNCTKLQHFQLQEPAIYLWWK